MKTQESLPSGGPLKAAQAGLGEEQGRVQAHEVGAFRVESGEGAEKAQAGGLALLVADRGLWGGPGWSPRAGCGRLPIAAPPDLLLSGS